jgi:hypothetical protein
MAADMNTIRTVSMVSLIAVAACSKRDPIGINLASAASNTAVTPSTATPEPTVPAIAADLDACDKDDKPFKPELATVAFTWSETPSLSDAPADGAYMQIGSGPVMKADEVEIWVDKKRASFDLRVRTKGPGLGPSITVKSLPRTGLVSEDKFGSNSGYFQVPKKGAMANCFKQTTSYNGQNARIVKITKYDEAKKTADGSFVTTWKEGFDEKRTFWAAGTFKNAHVVVFGS